MKIELEVRARKGGWVRWGFKREEGYLRLETAIIKD
jgi:hypothetical protein